MTRTRRLASRTMLAAAAMVALAGPVLPAAAMPDPPAPTSTSGTVATVPVEVEIPVDVTTTAEAIQMGIAALLGAAFAVTAGRPRRPRRDAHPPPAPAAVRQDLAVSASAAATSLDARFDKRETLAMGHNRAGVAPW